ncbi:hypothetical protein Tco_0144084 [Tanacetum coccineum]
MVYMVPHEAFACRCAEGDVVLRQSYKPESYVKLYYACPKSKPPKHFGCGFFLWKETRLRELMSSPGAPSYSAGHSTPPMDGGLFEHYGKFRNAMQKEMEELLGEEASKNIIIKQSNDGSGLGAALLAASNPRVAE